MLHYTGHLTDAQIRQMRTGRRMLRVWVVAVVGLVALLAVRWAEGEADNGERRARVKDISSIEGIRDNQLVGYGLVVGLQGTGDSQQTTFPTQTLAAMLLRMGVSVPAGAIRVQNLAAVFVSATLPPFARPGRSWTLRRARPGMRGRSKAGCC